MCMFFLRCLSLKSWSHNQLTNVTVLFWFLFSLLLVSLLRTPLPPPCALPPPSDVLQYLCAWRAEAYTTGRVWLVHTSLIPFKPFAFCIFAERLNAFVFLSNFERVNDVFTLRKPRTAWLWSWALTRALMCKIQWWAELQLHHTFFSGVWNSSECCSGCSSAEFCSAILLSSARCDEDAGTEIYSSCVFCMYVCA